MGAVESAPRAELDALRAQRVAHALAERLKDGAANVSAMIIGEIVHLEGSVGSDEERAEAERVAREVSGAQVTANDLRVE
jgi:osmotically-inducible protein OsmY